MPSAQALRSVGWTRTMRASGPPFERIDKHPSRRHCGVPSVVNQVVGRTIRAGGDAVVARAQHGTRLTAEHAGAVLAHSFGGIRPEHVIRDSEVDAVSFVLPPASAEEAIVFPPTFA